jgi:hypothetical protein
MALDKGMSLPSAWFSTLGKVDFSFFKNVDTVLENKKIFAEDRDAKSKFF